MASGGLDCVCLSAPMSCLSAPTLVQEADSLPDHSLGKKALFLFQGALHHTALLKHLLFHLCLKRRLTGVVQKSQVSRVMLALSPALRDPSGENSVICLLLKDSEKQIPMCTILCHPLKSIK